MVFLLCLALWVGVNFSAIPTHGWAPWTFQELTLQRIPDPVVPFTVGATVITTIALTVVLTPRIGVPRSVLVGISVPVSAVGVFELVYLFLLHPTAFWYPANPDPYFWGYVAALLSYAAFGLVGAGWWRIPSWWWPMLLGVIAGFAAWYAAGMPLTVASIGGHATPANLLGIALVVNVALKWAIFVLLAAPIATGARVGVAHRTPTSDRPLESAPGTSE